MPTAAIGADVMVGFPGETEAEFDETRRMIEELPFTYLHVFTYSARPGTPAAEQPGQVPAAVARERNRVLREIASGKKAAFMRSLVGTVVEAITLQSGGADFTEALTDNYLKMKISGRHEANRWMDVKVEGVNGEMLLAARSKFRVDRSLLFLHAHGQVKIRSNTACKYLAKNSSTRERVSVLVSRAFSKAASSGFSSRVNRLDTRPASVKLM